MDTSNNYKRTLAGSVGAGMGSLVSGGKTYYILEHKATSKYHQAGEAQKIIVDQIELGRDASCQVRFDESFETVSRRHAAIQREGDGWKLIHLSQSNPTLVNGRPISGTYFLQSGDEIQLSANGPRLGFIVPQGKQGLTSSIGMTERLNLFRKQALRPYKTALTIMGIALVVVVLGLGYWGYVQAGQIEEQAGQIEEQSEQIAQQQAQLAGYAVTADSLAGANARLAAQQQQLEAQLASGEGDKAALQDELSSVRSQLAYNNSVIYSTNKKMADLKAELAQNNAAAASASTAYETTSAGTTTSTTSTATTTTTTASASSSNAATDLRAYYPHIYTLKIDRIEVEKGGIRFDPGIPLSDIVCGTGFMLENGTFVTDRQNVHPWLYSDAQWKDDWRKLMAECVGAGCKVIIHYRAYSTKGTGQVLTFTNADFITDTSSDITTYEIEVRKSLRTIFKQNGIDVEYTRRTYVKAATFAPKVTQWACIRGLGTRGDGIPYDASAASNLGGGSEVQMVGYSGATSIHSLVPAHFNDRTNIDSDGSGAIVLQNSVNEKGYYGSPAFIQESDGTYKVVGVMVGSVAGKDRIVPIRKAL